MSRSNLIKDKKGEIGETVTWVVATIIIVGVLILFIWVSSVMANTMKIFGGSSEIKSDLPKKSSIIEGKNFFALRINNIDEERISILLGEKNG